MRVMIRMAAAAAALLMAAPALALTGQPYPSAASMEAAQHFASEARFAGGAAGLQARMVGSGLRADGMSEFSGDGADSSAYRTSAVSTDPAKRAERAFENDLSSYRAPGVTTHYAPAAQAK